MLQAKRAIKKYPNRRLYDTQASTYITLHDIRQMVLDGVDIRVEDARTREDLTRGVLLQIITDEESAGEPLFSIDSLKHLIRWREGSGETLLGAYLEKNLQLFDMLREKIDQQKASLPKSEDGMSAAAWDEFFHSQAPVLQRMMTSYLEQSATLYMSVQTQLRERGAAA